MNRPVRDSEYLYCPQCGKRMIWDDTQDRGCVDADGEPDPDYTTIDYWHCNHCGVSVEVWQALEEEKKNFDFWKEENNGK